VRVIGHPLTAVRFQLVNSGSAAVLFPHLAAFVSPDVEVDQATLKADGN
jgi:hypothetical protein